MDLIKFGWIRRDRSDKFIGKRFQRISILMKMFKSKTIENFIYVSIEEYFINNNNLYFIGNNEIYSIDLNNDFSYDYENFDLFLDDYKKIKYICEYSLENIFKYELICNKYKRDKRINELLNK